MAGVGSSRGHFVDVHSSRTDAPESLPGYGQGSGPRHPDGVRRPLKGAAAAQKRQTAIAIQSDEESVSAIRILGTQH